MSNVVAVKVAASGKVEYFCKNGLMLDVGDLCIVDDAAGARGCGAVVPLNPALRTHLDSRELKPIVRKATKGDLVYLDWKRRREFEAFSVCLQFIKKRQMGMKLVRVDYADEGERATFFYTAEGRVDFRELVRDLARELRLRIEMRQIGVRDEAKMLGGVGVCGRSLCCSSFLQRFEPVTVRMAKSQNMSTNPTKFTGVCGRLMCCVAFEAENGNAGGCSSGRYGCAAQTGGARNHRGFRTPGSLLPENEPGARTRSCGGCCAKRRLPSSF